MLDLICKNDYFVFGIADVLSIVKWMTIIYEAFYFAFFNITSVIKHSYCYVFIF